MNRYLNLLFFLILGFSLFGNNLSYNRFENFRPEAGVSTIFAFKEDERGMMWLGTNKGLYSYDGYSSFSHYNANDDSNTRIYCFEIVENKYIFFGSDNGLFIYDITKEEYLNSDSIISQVSSIKDIRSILLIDNKLLIGSLSGFYIADISTRLLSEYDLNNKGSNNRKIKSRIIEYNSTNTPEINNNAVYSIVNVGEGIVYIGTYDGLIKYDIKNDKFDLISTPLSIPSRNFFVNSLLYDRYSNLLWVGTEGELYNYDLTNNEFNNIKELSTNSIKSLALDAESRLHIGTDNGLFIYKNKNLEHILHDSRIPESLTNNIIWSIYNDRENNIWIGTDYGVSLNVFNKYTSYIPLSAITGRGDGNHIYNIFIDKTNSLWLGGTNGLIHINDEIEDVHNYEWYKMGDKTYTIPHNRIRNIFQDKQGTIWLASDGGLNIYNDKTKSFKRYDIIDSTAQRNSNWAYDILESNDGKIWISTCLGGIFVVDKESLLKSKQPYIADINIGTESGLNGMFVNSMVMDSDGNIWALQYNNGLNKIDYKTLKVTNVEYSNEVKDPNYLLADKSGNIWVNYRGGIMFFGAGNEQPEYISVGISDVCETFSMTEVRNEIWLSTSEGIWSINKTNRKSKRIGDKEKEFSSMYYDNSSDYVYLGYSNGIAVSTPERFKNASVFHPLHLTALYVNNQPVKKIDGKSIRYTHNFSFTHKENHLVFEFSDLPYSQEDKNKFVYMLEGQDNTWSIVPHNSNQIIYNSLNSGEYNLIVRRVGLDGKPIKSGLDIKFKILPPWYLTTTAKVIYVLLGIALIVWIILFIYVRNKLRAEHREKKQIIAQTKQKMEFFSNVSHEFKTPLSMIIAPLSRLLINEKDKDLKQQLELIQRNAMKLNSVIHKIIEFDRIDNNYTDSLILSGFDIIALAENIFNGFENGLFKEKNIIGQFSISESYMFVNADMIKVESIITNLISNSAKYCKENGKVEFKIEKENGQCVISVSDDGIGIPEKDLPYVSQRFFQSSLTAGNKEGTGIGLYLVKSYIELHNGTFSITSVENKGTVVKVALPIPEQEAERKDEVSVSDDKLLPLAIIIDDNTEITEFIKDVFKGSLRTITAQNGKEGISKIEEFNPDLIITDLMMPEMDGMEMCKIIRKNIRTSTTPIIMLTANSEKNNELYSLKLDIDAFITKPFDSNMLLLKAIQLVKKKDNEQIRQRIENISKPKEIVVESPDEKFLSLITLAIEERIEDSDLNVTSLCEQLQINNKQMYRKLKQLTGLSPVEYIKSIRLKKAAMLLNQNKFTVSEVLYMVGFSNPSYFSKCFQAEFGKTPKQYAEEQNQNEIK